jgi:hypothetical protein
LTIVIFREITLVTISIEVITSKSITKVLETKPIRQQNATQTQGAQKAVQHI